MSFGKIRRDNKQVGDFRMRKVNRAAAIKYAIDDAKMSSTAKSRKTMLRNGTGGYAVCSLCRRQVFTTQVVYAKMHPETWKCRECTTDDERSERAQEHRKRIELISKPLTVEEFMEDL